MGGDSLVNIGLLLGGESLVTVGGDSLVNIGLPLGGESLVREIRVATFLANSSRKSIIDSLVLSILVVLPRLDHLNLSYIRV